MKLQNIEILEKDNNKKGDLFGRLMGDLFHALGYGEPRLNIHKSGREIDLEAIHRTEKKFAKAECKAHTDTIGGSDINKFVGAIDAERRRIKKHSESFEIIGYFVSLSGFKETAIEQENDLNNDRVILLKPEKIVDELINGRILVSVEKAVASVNALKGKLTLIENIDLFAYERGWVWVVYFSDNDGQTASHFALVHAEGKPLIKELADEIIQLDDKTNKRLAGLNYLTPTDNRDNSLAKIGDAKEKYFKYLENECGEIQFEGLPTDKEAGSVKVKLENIFVPLHLHRIGQNSKKKNDSEESKRESIGNILKKNQRLAILAKPGGGKSTLIKRIAVAYAFPARREAVNDELPAYKWFPIFIRCRELGEKVSLSITEIINSIPNRAEIVSCTEQFSFLVSDSLQTGSALLLIDGLDEIAEDRNRIAFVNQLRTFIATYPNINIIVTSREAGFRVVAGSLATYCTHYTLAKLNDSEIEDLTIRWHREIIDDSEKTINEAKSLAAIIIRDSRIKVLAENPLLLTTLLFVKRWVGYLPTKRSLLYQEMIKLLLVTWNVEGHEQLDIDESEPQLAYVAFWMTLNGKQTITENELKDCLHAARKQMPDILGYTKISVPQFIRSVESRSSLLIMSGHTRLEDEQLTPIYEFLHLSFQEYLTARAIADGYLPEAQAKESVLEILKPNIEKENWREVIPLVAVLAKRDNRELIEYLINKAREIAKERIIDPKKRVLGDNAVLILLGNCIANEIQINPELLENALEWFAKNRFPVKRSIENIILNSKFGEAYRRKINSLFYGVYDDKFAVELASSLSTIYLLDLKTTNGDEISNSICKDIKDNVKEKKCSAILALMYFAFSLNNEFLLEYSEPEKSLTNNLSEIYDELLKLLKSDDKHYHLSICWCIAWLEENNLFPDEYREEFVKTILYLWFKYEEYNLFRMTSWALREILRPSLNIDFSAYPNIEQKILKTFNDNQDKKDKIAAVYLGILAKIKWDRKEIVSIFQEMRKRRNANKAMLAFANTLGIKIEESEIEEIEEI